MAWLTRVKCPIAKPALSQRNDTVVRCRNHQANTLFWGALLAIGRSSASVNPRNPSACFSAAWAAASSCATSSRKPFPPQLLQVEAGHGRMKWRGIAVLSITPERMGFPHVVQLARVGRIRQLKSGRQKVLTVWLITSLSPERADAARARSSSRPDLARQYRRIENGTHYRLDVSIGEDRCRVRHPTAATVLGVLRREVQGEYRAWARGVRRARDRTCPAFLEKMSRRIDRASYRD